MTIEITKCEIITTEENSFCVQINWDNNIEYRRPTIERYYCERCGQQHADFVDKELDIRYVFYAWDDKEWMDNKLEIDWFLTILKMRVEDFIEERKLSMLGLQ